MNKYRIFETERFQKDLQHIVISGQSKLGQKLKEFIYPQLRNHSHFGPKIKKLKGYKPETGRYRIGSWRFFYEINEQERIVFMLAVSHRSSAYLNLTSNLSPLF